MMYEQVQPNIQGKDYVVGDIHGMFDELITELDRIGFDYDNDRLFAVGDLVDRGHQNLEVLQLLKSRWFYSVRGNHEQWAIDNFTYYNTQMQRSHMTHGGMWFYDLDDTWQQNVVRICQTLPLMLETEVDGKRVGFVHGDISDWDTARITIKELLEEDIGSDITAAKLLWGRTRIQNGIALEVKGIDHVFLGHTPLEKVVRLGNTTYIDTGAVFGNKLTILNINDYLKET